MDVSKLVRADFAPEVGSLYPAIMTLRNACDVLEGADKTPDEAVRKPLIAGTRQMLQNVIDALKEPDPEPDQTEDD